LPASATTPEESRCRESQHKCAAEEYGGLSSREAFHIVDELIEILPFQV
jgi:hypothetical protein